MNKNLRRFLGREQRSDSEKGSKKKRSKRALPSLLFHRPAATENYYCRSFKGQQKDSCPNQNDDVDLKKGDLIIDTEEADASTNVNEVIEVALEPIRDDSVQVQTSQILDDLVEHETKTQQTTFTDKNQTVKQTIPTVSTSPMTEASSEIMEQVLEVEDHDGGCGLGVSSKSVLHNALPQAAPMLHDFESQTQRNQPNESGYANTDKEEQPSYNNEHINHPAKVVCLQISQGHQQTAFGVHTTVNHSNKEDSFHREILQAHGSVSQDTVQRSVSSCLTAAIVRPEICQHQPNTPSAGQLWHSDAKGKCGSEMTRDCDWGWVTANSRCSTGTTSHRESETNEHVCVSNAIENRSRCYRCSFEPSSSSACLSSCCHGDRTNHFLIPDRTTVSNCTCCMQERFACHSSSNLHRCLPAECSIPRKRLPPPCNCVHRFENPLRLQSSPEEATHSSIRFAVRNESNATVFHEIPCLSLEGRKCHQQQPMRCSSGGCHSNEPCASAMDWEPYALRAWKRPLTATNCATTSRDSFECRKQCCHNFNQSHLFPVDEAAMAPSVTFFSDVQEVNGSLSFCHQPPCCRIPPVCGGNNQFCGANCRGEVKNPYDVTNPFAPFADKAHVSPKPLGQFQLSSKSYAKLIAYCHTKNILRGVPHGNNTYPNTHNIHGHEACGTFASPLDRIPIHACNEYSPPGQTIKSHTVYENQAAIDMCKLARVFETVEQCPWYWGELSGQEAKKVLNGTPVGTFLLRDSSDKSFLFSLSLMTKQGPTSIRIVYRNGNFRLDSDRDDGNNIRRRCSSPDTIRETDRHRRCVIHMILRYTKYLTEQRWAEKGKITNSKSVPTACVMQNNSSSDSSSIAQRISNSVAPSGDQILQNGVDTGREAALESGQFLCSWMGRGGRREIQVSLAHPLLKRRTRSLQELSRSSISKKLNLWKNPEKIAELPLPFSLKQFIKKYPYPV